VYEYGNDRLSYATPEETLYYAYDGQTSVSNLTNAEGRAVASYSYTPNGEVFTDDASNNPYNYNGEYTDHATKDQYLRARYYSPTTRSFLTQDTYLGEIEEPLSRNLYTYAENNPVNFNDPSGHGIFSSIKSGFKKAGSVIKKAVSTVKITVNKTVNTMKSIAKNLVNKATTAAKNTLNKAVNTVTNTMSNVVKSSEYRDDLTDRPHYDKNTK